MLYCSNVVLCISVYRFAFHLMHGDAQYCFCTASESEESVEAEVRVEVEAEVTAEADPLNVNSIATAVVCDEKACR